MKSFTQISTILNTLLYWGGQIYHKFVKYLKSEKQITKFYTNFIKVLPVNSKTLINAVQDRFRGIKNYKLTIWPYRIM